MAKSTTLAHFGIVECSLIPHFSTLFINPSVEQTKRFSSTRVTKVMRYSPIINRKFLSPELSDRVFHKQFSNGSEMVFSYGLDDADRLRGLSADRNIYDEIQDILYDPVVVIGNECLTHSRYAYETYAGTPKTMENTIQYLWEQSTQTEWVMRCDACSTYQYAESEKCVGKKGIICLKCGGYLNPFEGQWVDMCPAQSDDENIMYEDRIKGFHICQPGMPESNPIAVAKMGFDNEAVAFATKQWGDVLYKLETYPTSKFRNEVLGISDTIGTRLISKEELEALCTDIKLYPQPNPESMRGCVLTVAGVDWSGGGTSGLSRTVLWVWGIKQPTKLLQCLFYGVYPGVNPVHSVEDIIKVCEAYRVALIIGDAGEGSVANDLLRKSLGHARVMQVQYGSQAKAFSWNGQDRYLADRTTMIDNYLMLLKNKQVMFGVKAEMSTAISDILNEYEDVTQMGKKVWRHSPQKPDDCLHAGLFGWLAAKIILQDLKFYQE